MGEPWPPRDIERPYRPDGFDAFKPVWAKRPTQEPKR